LSSPCPCAGLTAQRGGFPAEPGSRGFLTVRLDAPLEFRAEPVAVLRETAPFARSARAPFGGGTAIIVRRGLLFEQIA